MSVKYMKMKNQPRGNTFVLIGTLTFLCVLVLLYALRRIPEFSQYRRVCNYPPEPSSRSPRTILLWNPFFTDDRWGLSEATKSPDDFRDELQCPVYNCELTNNRDFLPSLDMYDAVLFHAAQPYPFLNPVPTVRSPHQLYIFALMEPPGETKHVLDDENDFYNLTMTYRLDSDISWNYGLFVDIETGSIVAPSAEPKWRQPPEVWNDSSVWELWPQKTNSAAWFVSHCDTLSQRERLAADLQRHIDVDIFGKCGPKSCEQKSSACDKMLDEKYKFYLSFENSLCTDYVTEKFYNAMQRLIVPIVFGGANYSRFAPPHSYINAEDFPSAKALAEYLKYLSEHPEIYMRYFWWREFYELTNRSPFCEVCEKLHSITYQLKTQSYRNIERWWLGGSCRFKSKIQF